MVMWSYLLDDGRILDLRGIKSNSQYFLKSGHIFDSNLHHLTVVLNHVVGIEYHRSTYVLNSPKNINSRQPLTNFLGRGKNDVQII